MRVIRGHFRQSPGGAPRASAMPFVNVRFPHATGEVSYEFLVDTGADFTTLNPRDAVAVFGASYFNIDFSDYGRQVKMVGIGQGDSVGLMFPADLQLVGTDGEQIGVELPILVPEPFPRVPGEHGNWLIPSLLGRDVLEWFDLALSYNPPTVSLMEADSPA